jgi:asparagine synthase (glutamine-hydrolysing)
MFACAIWDKNNGKLVLARDRLGIKPLYYSEDSSQLIFSSEIKAILMNKDFHKEVNNDGLNQYLAFQCILTNQTMFKGIFKLEPGHILVFKDGQKYKRSYWSIEDSISPLAQEDILKTNLISAVGSHLVSDVPLGVLLSGGLDSSSIVAIMHELRIKDINTFTVGFSRPDDEFKFGRLVAERFKTRHQEILIQPRQLENLLEKIAWHMDEPLADGGAIATYLASGRIKEFVKVVLVGEGGDEALGGYNWHKLAAFPFNLLPRYYRKKIYQYLVTYYKKRSEEPMRIFLELFPKKKVFFDAMALFELKNIVSNSILMKVDKMTMAHSLEARVPFLDHNFLSCALGLSFREKVSFKTTKKVLRKLMKDKLPLAILKRKKHGFLLPVHEWLEKDLRNFAQDILISNNRYTNSLVGNQEIRGLFKRRKGFALVENSSLLWRLLIFELWYKVYFKQG